MTADVVERVVGERRVLVDRAQVVRRLLQRVRAAQAGRQPRAVQLERAARRHCKHEAGGASDCGRVNLNSRITHLGNFAPFLLLQWSSGYGLQVQIVLNYSQADSIYL